MHRTTKALVALIIILSLAAPAGALEPWRMVVRVKGKVESHQPGGDWSPIWRSRLLSDGDYARTMQDSRAVVRLADQSEFTIGSDTIVEMTRFSLTPEGRTVVFNLQVGKIRARVAKALGKQSRFEVKTPNGVLAARGTEFFVEQEAPATAMAALPGVAAGPAGPGNTIVRVFEGRVDFAGPDGTRTFSAGDYGFITPGGAIHFNPPDMHPNQPAAPAGGDGPAAGPGDGPGDRPGDRPGGDGDLSSAPGPRDGSPTGPAPPPNTMGDGARPGDTGSRTGDNTVPDPGSPNNVNVPPPVYNPNNTSPKTGTIPIIIQP